MKTKENITTPTPEEIQKWKDLYGKVHTLEVPEKFITADGEEFDDEDQAKEHASELVEGKRGIEEVTVKCYLRTPTRKVISSATVIAGKDPMKFGELILQNCWLGGDERIKNEDELFFAANGILGDLIKVRTAKLKNC